MKPDLLTGSNHGRTNELRQGTRNDLERQKHASFALSEDQVSEALKDLIRSLGFDLLTMTPDNKGEVAEKLSRVAGVSPAWTWRYVHNVMGRKIEASQKFAGAVLKMLAIVDGANPLMVRAKPVQVYAINEVSAGAVILAASRMCANPRCPIVFVPVVPRQRFCCAECRKGRAK